MSFLHELHDYVKKNYEAGEYDEAQTAYQDWAKEKQSSKVQDDYQMGYEAAQSDYDQGKQFKHFPAGLTKLVNKLSQDRAHEISEYIRGYQEAAGQLKKEAEN
ncbi:hypothetical protein [Eupransor demetentiae]|uniref:Uncharacterized protein n=1 Tax=Eupransor demetentiae TaxID=3109584 RepID=A0ABM9N6Q8_9LACO|nr:hypothetical protein R54876_GBNLAHCA_01468 [Lactobacillaceae bacterium LMG 33000]